MRYSFTRPSKAALHDTNWILLYLGWLECLTRTMALPVEAMEKTSAKAVGVTAVSIITVSPATIYFFIVFPLVFDYKHDFVLLL